MRQHVSADIRSAHSLPLGRALWAVKTMRRVLVSSLDVNLRNALATIPNVALTVDSTRHRTRDLVLSGDCDAVVLDLDLRPAAAQLDLIEDLRGTGIPVIVVAGDDPACMRELERRGIEHHCRKPLLAHHLKLLELAIQRTESEESVAPESPLGCGGLVGWSAASQAVYGMIRRVAPLDVFVIITGENGTGKELIARAIHSLGDRAAKPFVAVSCGAVPDSLIEAELFGCEKGAFTGASARRVGYFEEAANGTLLLDEIGELSLHTQTRLLRVLQEREFMRLGSSTAIPLRARMLFATNRNLRQMMEAGTFREDLYYRLNVVGIHSQPLRERRDDIPLLAEHFLSHYARTYRRSIVSISRDVLGLFCRYDWPGNVRELENVIQRAIVLCDKDTIVPSDLPDHMRESGADAPEEAASDSFEDRVHEFRIRLAMDALRECHGSKTLAAQRLNISRTYLHRLIRHESDSAELVA